MTEQEIKLSVEVPELHEEENDKELEMDQENEEPKLSLDLPQGDEEAERARYGLNSPKRDKQNKELDDEAEAEADAEVEVEAEDEGEMTPATKLRQTAGINSPKQQKSLAWGSTEDKDTTNALAGVITQVAPPTQNQSSHANGGGVQSLVTQVSRDDAKPVAAMRIQSYTYDKDEQNTTETQKQKSGGMCACLSCLFHCCSSRRVEAQTVQQIEVHQEEVHQENVGQEPQASEINAVTDKVKSSAEEDEKEASLESSTDYSNALLPPVSPENKGKRCLVLDLDETLVHSAFKPVNAADFVIPVEIDGVVHRVYVLKRPFVDEFLLECSKSYELVIFTASLSKYADPLLDQLDKQGLIAHRLFRESCTLHGSSYVKDMRRLGRRLKDVIFVDNSPHSYAFQPKNAVPITSWFDDKSDTELRDFIPVLDTTLLKVKDVRHVLDAHNRSFDWLCQQANVDISKFKS